MAELTGTDHLRLENHDRGTENASDRQSRHSAKWRLEIRKRQGNSWRRWLATGICYSGVIVGSVHKGASPLAVYARVLGHEPQAKTNKDILLIVIQEPAMSLLSNPTSPPP
ncbi:hypothetical protein AC578_5017 [Pseudocercospora eumusae]|uniref:Uncharacterized protein n=1 Tax=Pseudocercospora eumusae TaxID=321146 RepID=A0A139GX14_9PEZI|nr:hypothetical protein AC578_5017 [Pseudocercospora eumusae]